ncbi:MAG: DsrE family protein [Parvularculaceae bacterium]
MRPEFTIAHAAPAAMLMAIAIAPAADAGEDAFHAGTVIADYGQVATVVSDVAIPAETKFKVAFDINTAGDAGEVNRSLNSAARFLNMHAEAGVDPGDISLALVVHGGAVKDVARRADGAENPNAALIAALADMGVQIYVCGQSAAYYDIGNDDLLPGVEMALSAMTMHALLQQQGYTLNPF